MPISAYLRFFFSLYASKIKILGNIQSLSLLHCDCQRAGQFIVDIKFAVQCNLSRTRSWYSQYKKWVIHWKLEGLNISPLEKFENPFKFHRDSNSKFSNIIRSVNPYCPLAFVRLNFLYISGLLSWLLKLSGTVNARVKKLRQMYQNCHH